MFAILLKFEEWGMGVHIKQGTQNIKLELL